MNKYLQWLFIGFLVSTKNERTLPVRIWNIDTATITYHNNSILQNITTHKVKSSPNLDRAKMKSDNGKPQQIDKTSSASLTSSIKVASKGSFTCKYLLS